MSRQIYAHHGNTKASPYPVTTYIFPATHHILNIAGFATLARYLPPFYSNFITNITPQPKHNVGRPRSAP